MIAKCELCGTILPRMRLFRVTCSSCGAKHVAVRSKKFYWISASYGALPFILVPLVLVLPGSFWPKFGAVSSLYIAAGLWIEMAAHQWRLVDDSLIR
jgi:hypothetical protein